MPAAQYPLRKWQVGFEATPGTGVPATWIMMGQGVYQPVRTRYLPDWPHGIRVMQTGGGVDIAQMANFTFTGDNTFEELLYPLASSFGAPTPTTALGATTWNLTPSLAAVPSPKSFTGEFWLSDGTNNVFASKSAFMLSTGFSLQFDVNQKSGLSWNGFGQAEQSAITPTPALTVMTGREVLASQNTTWSIDPTWAGLGATPSLGTVRSAKIDFVSGLAPDPTMDGRASQDWSTYMFGNITAHLSLTCEHNLNVQAELTAWRNKTLRFIRAKNVSNGPVVGTSALHKTQQIDLAMVYAKEPVFSNNGAVEIATLDLQLEYDPTSSKALAFQLINAISALT